MSGKKHLCVIDDDQVYQFTIKKTLEHRDTFSRVSFFNDGKEGINYLKSKINSASDLPDVILLDLNMPVLDGWGFMEEFMAIREQLAKPVHIYLVTSSIDFRDRERAKNYSEVSDFKIKPITYEELSLTLWELS